MSELERAIVRFEFMAKTLDKPDAPGLSRAAEENRKIADWLKELKERREKD